MVGVLATASVDYPEVERWRPFIHASEDFLDACILCGRFGSSFGHAPPHLRVSERVRRLQACSDPPGMDALVGVDVVLVASEEFGGHELRLTIRSEVVRKNKLG